LAREKLFPRAFPVRRYPFQREVSRNKARQAWQHPCGMYRDQRATYDPRQRYYTGCSRSLAQPVTANKLIAATLETIKFFMR
jgi:hypothetical protein